MKRSPRKYTTRFGVSHFLLLLALGPFSVAATVQEGQAHRELRRPASERDQFVAAISELAIVEATYSGIPASITAAQAILESDWGRSPLARAGNNYFGIKCKSYWRGEVIRHRDDDYDASGRLVESCFRAYGSVAESFRDHSEFLRRTPRYAALFELDREDYRGWASGLKRAGYATDSAYATKLVALIERLALHELDWAESDFDQWLMAMSEESRPPQDQPTFTESVRPVPARVLKADLRPGRR